MAVIITYPSRVVVHIVPYKGARWAAQLETRFFDEDNTVFEVAFNKAEFVSRMGARLSAMWRNHDVSSQLIVHARNGKIQTEHTYGHDPKRSKG